MNSILRGINRISYEFTKTHPMPWGFKPFYGVQVWVSDISPNRAYEVDVTIDLNAFLSNIPMDEIMDNIGEERLKEWVENELTST